MLFAGLVVGVLAGLQRFAPFEVLFGTAFKPILAFFVLERGLLTALRWPKLKKNGSFICVAAVVVPLIGGGIGGWLGVLTGLSPGGATVLATLAASASSRRAWPFRKPTPACAWPRP